MESIIDNISNAVFNKIVNEINEDKHIQQINNYYDKIEESERLNTIQFTNVKEIVCQKLKEKYPNYYIDVEHFSYKEKSKREIYECNTRNLGFNAIITLGVLLPWVIREHKRIWKETNPIYCIKYVINFRKSMVIEEEWSSLKTRRNKNV